MPRSLGTAQKISSLRIFISKKLFLSDLENSLPRKYTFDIVQSRARCVCGCGNLHPAADPRPSSQPPAVLSGGLRAPIRTVTRSGNRTFSRSLFAEAGEQRRPQQAPGVTGLARLGPQSPSGTLDHIPFLDPNAVSVRSGTEEVQACEEQTEQCGQASPMIWEVAGGTGTPARTPPWRGPVQPPRSVVDSTQGTPCSCTLCALETRQERGPEPGLGSVLWGLGVHLDRPVPPPPPGSSRGPSPAGKPPPIPDFPAETETMFPKQ